MSDLSDAHPTDEPRHRAERPAPRGSDLVLVRVAALVRTPGTRPRHAFAGVVEGVGESVVGFVPGDAVCGFAEGAFAGWACAPESQIAHLPPEVGFEEAALRLARPHG